MRRTALAPVLVTSCLQLRSAVRSRLLLPPTAHQGWHASSWQLAIRQVTLMGWPEGLPSAPLQSLLSALPPSNLWSACLLATLLLPSHLHLMPPTAALLLPSLCSAVRAHHWRPRLSAGQIQRSCRHPGAARRHAVCCWWAGGQPASTGQGPCVAQAGGDCPASARPGDVRGLTACCLHLAAQPPHVVALGATRDRRWGRVLKPAPATLLPPNQALQISLQTRTIAAYRSCTRTAPSLRCLGTAPRAQVKRHAPACCSRVAPACAPSQLPRPTTITSA